jgi:hypothetical protein
MQPRSIVDTATELKVQVFSPLLIVQPVAELP